ncbi:1-phosphofructokinase family hexose kinase [Phytohabitans sp. LJ34]|uniref:1-phosphofructokinase family hexose kinase n=1 Tax=Phytohabitans sp. LJ34 TaxID=3452217 RepID=UPI003F8C7722
MSSHVLVFAPAPQLTVTVEQPADTVEIHVHPGGQGVWQARMITELGPAVVMCATVGGEIGQVLRALIAAEDIELRAVTREATSGGYVHDRRDGSRAEIAEVAGEPLSRHELDELYSLTLAAALDAPVAVLSGPADPSVLPADTYRRLAADLGGNGVKVVADLSGDHLAAVLEGEPYLVKVSHEELIDDGRANDDSDPELLDALRGLHGDGARAVLVSRAAKGALALIDGEAYEVDAPRLEVADARGAGDSMTAGVAAVLAQGGDLATAVRTGAAAGALNVTRHGLGSGRADAVRSLVDRVRLKRLER